MQIVRVSGDILPTRNTVAVDFAALPFRVKRQWMRNPLAILAVQQIPHRPSPSLVRLGQRLTLIGIHASLSRRCIALRFAARRTPVGKSRLPWLELELLGANGADFDRKCHAAIILTSAPHGRRNSDSQDLRSAAVSAAVAAGRSRASRQACPKQRTVFRPVSTIRNKGLMRPVSGERSQGLPALPNTG
jgi:hypothetical protein